MKYNVILIIIDALRSKNLGCYGYDKNTSIHIDALAKEGIIFNNAFSTTNTTDSSLTSILSGKYPLSHGIRTHAEQVTKDIISEFDKSDIKFVQEILRNNGYHTISIDYLNRWYKKGFDKCLPDTAKYPSIFNTIFKKFFRQSPALLQQVIGRFRKKVFKKTSKEGERLTKITLKNINEFSITKEPFFLFLHYWDAHIPYNPPKNFLKYFPEQKYDQKMELTKIIKGLNGIWKRRLKIFTKGINTTNQMLARYDASIKYVDEQIGDIVGMLKQNNIFDDTLLIITSDHGESLTEHCIYFDHHGLYDESIHIPLIIKYPKINHPNRIDTFVQHVDIFPTILETLKIPLTHRIDGLSLTPMINKGDEIRNFIFAEESYTEKKKCIRTKEYKYISAETQNDALCRYCGATHGGIEELYDLRYDSKEMNNILSEKPEVALELKNRLENFTADLINKKKNDERNKINRVIKKLKETKKF
jgi:arylsulfatase A-like enzyme